MEEEKTTLTIRFNILLDYNSIETIRELIEDNICVGILDIEESRGVIENEKTK